MPLTFLCALAVAIDGDTLRCANVEAANGRVRLARIDAAELRAPGGEQARRALQAMIEAAGEEPVTCRQVDADPRIAGFQAHDRYGRVVARCSASGGDFGTALLRAGLAKRWP